MKMAKVKMNKDMRLNPTGGRNQVIDAKEGDIVEIREDFVEGMGEAIELLKVKGDEDYAEIKTTAQLEANPELLEKDAFEEEDAFDLESADLDALREKAKEFGVDARGSAATLRKRIKEKAEELTKLEEEEDAFDLNSLDREGLLANLAVYFPEEDEGAFNELEEDELRAKLKEGLNDEDRVKAVAELAEEKSEGAAPTNKSLDKAPEDK